MALTGCSQTQPRPLLYPEEKRMQINIDVNPKGFRYTIQGEHMTKEDMDAIIRGHGLPTPPPEIKKQIKKEIKEEGIQTGDIKIIPQARFKE